jgi:hypothetical protein
VNHFTARAGPAAYLSIAALEPGLGLPHFGNGYEGGRAMLPFESYRDVLREHACGRHLVASAWILVAALALLLVIVA